MGSEYDEQLGIWRSKFEVVIACRIINWNPFITFILCARFVWSLKSARRPIAWCPRPVRTESAKGQTSSSVLSASIGYLIGEMR
jgi:hypothetical protein